MAIRCLRPHWLLGHLSLLGNNVIEGQYSVCVERTGGSLGLSTFCGAPVLSVLDAEAAERTANSLVSDEEINDGPTLQRCSETGLLMINGKRWR
jgi:hypothetical protein